MSEASPACVLVLGSAEWSAPIATNQHYVARELGLEFDVVFAEGTGTRGPRLSAADLGRVVRRLRSQTGAPRRGVPPGVSLLPTKLLPHTWRQGRVNSWWLGRQTRSWASAPGPKVLWTYTPYTYGLEERADVVVYHLVDLVHENQGVDVAGYLAAESRLAPAVDQAVATSAAVADHLHQAGMGRVMTRGNVADTRVFAAAAGAAGPRRREVVFAGALSARKLDTELLEGLLDRLPADARLTLVGPVGSRPADKDLVRRLATRGAAVRPAEALPQLARRLAGAAVGIVPYRLDELTRGISPLKVYEYLACGLPVVTTALPSVVEHPGAVYVERTADAFADRVLALLQHDDPGCSAARRRTAAEHDWSHRGQELRDMLRGLLRPVPCAPGRA